LGVPSPGAGDRARAGVAGTRHPARVSEGASTPTPGRPHLHGPVDRWMSLPPVECKQKLGGRLDGGGAQAPPPTRDDRPTGPQRLFVVYPLTVPAHCPIISGAVGGSRRSEEHTSELQSRENLVCRLLL